MVWRGRAWYCQAGQGILRHDQEIRYRDHEQKRDWIRRFYYILCLHVSRIICRSKDLDEGKKLRISGFYCIFDAFQKILNRFNSLPLLHLMMDSGGFSKTVQTTLPAGEYCNIIDSCSSKVRLGSLVLLRWDLLESSSTKVSLWSSTTLLTSDLLYHQVEPLISCSTKVRAMEQRL